MYLQSDTQDCVVKQIYDDALAAAAAAVLDPSRFTCPEVRVRWHEMLGVERDAWHGSGLHIHGSGAMPQSPPCHQPRHNARGMDMQCRPCVSYAQCKHEQVCGRLLAAYMALNPSMEAASAKRVALVAVAHRCRELLEGMTPVLKVLACMLRLQLGFNHILVHVIIRHKL